MNRDDIIRMAREAGYGDAMADLHAPALERFAALVAAAQRQWVWLSREDEQEIKNHCTTVTSVLRSVKAKLREKNGGAS